MRKTFTIDTTAKKIHETRTKYSQSIHTASPFHEGPFRCKYIKIVPICYSKSANFDIKYALASWKQCRDVCTIRKFFKVKFLARFSLTVDSRSAEKRCCRREGCKCCYRRLHATTEPRRLDREDWSEKTGLRRLDRGDWTETTGSGGGSRPTGSEGDDRLPEYLASR